MDNMNRFGVSIVTDSKEVPMSYAQQARRLLSVGPRLVFPVALAAVLAVVASVALMQFRDGRVVVTTEAQPAPAAALAPIWAPPPGQEFVNPRLAPAAAQAPSWVPPQAQAYVNPRVAPAAKLNTPFDFGTGSAYDGQLQRYRAYAATDVSESFKAFKAQQAQERADAAVVLPVKPNYSALPQGLTDYVPAPQATPVSGTNYSPLPPGLTDYEGLTR